MATTNKNRIEYQKRVNRVLDHIRARPSEELSLDDLAAVAGFSPFHFHRIFKAMTGENLKEHIQRTRLESAATTLVTRPHVDILEVALENGFSSASAFARAFKERFAMTASAWRKGGAPDRSKDGQSNSKPCTTKGKGGKAGQGRDRHDDLTSGCQARENKEDIMDVLVQTLPTYRVAYMRTIGPYGVGGGIQDVWQRMARWAGARDLWTPDRLCLGIGHDNPKVTEPARCRYDAAIVIPAGFTPDGDVNVGEIEGGKYAVVHFVGKGPEVGSAYDGIFAWLPNSGYQPENRCIFELYRGEFMEAETGNFRCDVCVPVRPL